MHIYLGGPVKGCNVGEAHDWRNAFSDRLAAIGMIGVSPLRCEPLIGERYGMGYDDPMFGTPEAIAAKNLLDVKRCDLTIGYFPEDITKMAGPSLGTVSELAWAHALGKPTILVSTVDAVRKHPVVLANSQWRLDSLDQAFSVINGVLRVYTQFSWADAVNAAHVRRGEQ